MAKLFNITRPRRRNLLLARAFLFAISIVLSSGEHVEPYDTTEANLLAMGSGVAIDELVARGLHSKAAKSKSSKIGGSNSAGSKGSKSKSAKSKSAKAKSGKSKSKSGKVSKSKSAKSLVSSAKSKSEKGKSEKSVSSAKSKSEKEGKSEKSEDEKLIYSTDSEEYLHTKSLSDNEVSSSDAEAENVPMPMPTEDEASVATQSVAASAETSSVYYETIDVEGDPDDAQSVSSSVSVPNSSTEGNMEATGTDRHPDAESVNSSVSSPISSTEGNLEATGTTRPVDTSASLDGVEVIDMDVVSAEDKDVMETPNLDGDFMEERVEESVPEGSFSSNDIISQEEIEDTSNARSGVEASSQADEVMEEAPHLESVFVEERIEEEGEALDNLDENEAELDPSRESVE